MSKNMEKIYYIGGSPCSGKSTLAEMMEKKYNYKYFKLDDQLEEYMKKGKTDGKPSSSGYFEMTPDEIWLRAPEAQNTEEFEIYREIFEYALMDLKRISQDTPIIAEGAGFLPELMKKIGVPKNEYVCIVPTKEFQCEKYSQRPWIPYILEGCSDKKLAFKNWMDRDALFAIDAAMSAKKLGYTAIIVDGTASIEENLAVAEKVFELRR